MKTDVKNILKEACRRSRRNKESSAREEHFDMSDVDRVLEERAKLVSDLESSHQLSSVAVQVKPNEIKEKRVFKAASLSDIFGFNPQKKVQEDQDKSKDVPEKWKPYYERLVQLKKRLQNTEDETSDDDPLLSLVMNPKETLEEIDAAIDRILDGSYGVCEVTGKPISQQRLESIPYTRYSLEGQAQLEEAKRIRLLAQAANNTQRISDSEDGDTGQQGMFYETDEDQDLNTELDE